jgi:hypothetical protein
LSEDGIERDDHIVEFFVEKSQIRSVGRVLIPERIRGVTPKCGSCRRFRENAEPLVLASGFEMQTAVP